MIFNTLSITLAQRIRELATLRTLGASRRQIKRSVLTEGLAIGVFASVVGLVLGLALAKGLNGLFQLFGIDLPHAATVIEPRTIIVALSLGTIVTLIASLSPARRATRIAPIAAMREGATLPPRLGARRPSIPMAILAVAAVLCLAGALGGGSIGRSMILVGLGSLALFLGVIMIAGRLIRPLVAIVGGPARRFGGPPGPTGQRQLNAQHHAHGHHRRRPDDRARARHACRDDGKRLSRLGAKRRREDGQGRLRRDLQERL